jgi:hypothetical protein
MKTANYLSRLGLITIGTKNENGSKTGRSIVLANKAANYCRQMARRPRSTGHSYTITLFFKAAGDP